MTNPNYRDDLPVRLYESEASIEATAARSGIDPARVIDFSLNINPFGPPRAAVAAATSVLARSNEYPDLRLPALRRALARRHDVADEALLFGAGLDDVIKLLVHALSAEGGNVLIHLPTFPRYELEARLRGARVWLVENDPPWTIGFDGIVAALARTKVELAFLCTPNNPTGESIPGDTIAELAAAHADSVFIVDEALIDPLHPGALPDVRDAPNVIVLRTFSKYFGLAGMRIGYAIGPAAVMRLIERGRPPFNVSHAAEAAAIAALDDTAFLAECRATFASESMRFRAALEPLAAYRLRGHHANMVLIEALRHSAATLIDALAARGFLTADAACFGGLGEHAAIRVSLRERAANDRLLAALKAVS